MNGVLAKRYPCKTDTGRMLCEVTIGVMHSEAKEHQRLPQTTKLQKELGSVKT